jgi:hypothetical protein
METVSVSGGWGGSNRKAELPDNWPQMRLATMVAAGWRCQAIRKDGTRCPKRATDCDHYGDKNDHTKLRALCGFHHDQRSSRQGVEARRELTTGRRRPPERHPGELRRTTMHNKIRAIVPAVALAALVALGGVAAPTLAAGTAPGTNYAVASDGFPAGAPPEAIWQPAIRAEDLVGFVDTYGADRIEIVRIDGLMLMHADWRGIGAPVKSARDIGAGKTEFVAVGASGRSIGVRVADDVVLTINVAPAVR